MYHVCPYKTLGNAAAVKEMVQYMRRIVLVGAAGEFAEAEAAAAARGRCSVVNCPSIEVRAGNDGVERDKEAQRAGGEVALLSREISSLQVESCVLVMRALRMDADERRSRRVHRFG